MPGKAGGMVASEGEMRALMAFWARTLSRMARGGRGAGRRRDAGGGHRPGGRGGGSRTRGGAP